MILNLSFISDSESLLHSLETIKRDILPVVTAAKQVAKVRFLRVAEIGGAPVSMADPQSYSIHLEFESKALLDEFLSDVIAKPIAAYTSTFGEKSVVFSTTLEEIAF
jgi:hypothetical protein